MGDVLGGALGGDLSVQIVCCGDPATKLLVVVGTCNDDVEVVLGADLLVGQLSDSSRSLLVLDLGLVELLGSAVQVVVVAVLDGLGILNLLVIQSICQCLADSTVGQSAASQHGQCHNTGQDDGQKFLCHFHDFCLHK